MIRYFIILLFLVVAGAFAYHQFSPNINLFGRAADLTGIWIDQTGKVAVELFSCAGAVCGRVAWVHGGPNQTGVDGNKLCGARVLGGLYRTSNTTWDGGWIYNPLDGGRYSVYIELLRTNVLSVTGYMGSRWFGQTFEWRKAPSNLKICAP